MASFVVLVVVVTTLGLTGKFNQGGIFIPRITLILTMPHRPTPILTLSPTGRFTQMPLLQITADAARYGDNFDQSVLVFEYWDFIGSPFSDKGRANLYIRVFGAWKYHQPL